MCEGCGIAFTAYANRVKRGRSRFHSKACADAAKCLRYLLLGEPITTADMATIAGIDRTTIFTRLTRLGVKPGDEVPAPVFAPVVT